jgi:hypothetical protein
MPVAWFGRVLRRGEYGCGTDRTLILPGFLAMRPCGSIVPVGVVDVREVRVNVREYLVDVCVGMRVTGRISGRMGMLVMGVVAVRVDVGRRSCVWA